MRKSDFALLALVFGLAFGPTLRAEPTAMKGLEGALVAKKKEYVLAPAFAKAGFVESLKKRKGDEPAPPEVDLELVLTNTGDTPVTLRPGHDGQILELKLEGPGAVTHSRQIAMTTDYRMGEPLVIAPGKSHTIPIKKLAFGKRGISTYAYWTMPGEYSLAALLRLPEPNGGKFVRTKAITLTVVEPSQSGRTP